MRHMDTPFFTKMCFPKCIISYDLLRYSHWRSNLTWAAVTSSIEKFVSTGLMCMVLGTMPRGQSLHLPN